MTARQVSCPHCRQLLSVGHVPAGKSVQCPHCRTIFPLENGAFRIAPRPKPAASRQGDAPAAPPNAVPHQTAEPAAPQAPAPRGLPAAGLLMVAGVAAGMLLTCCLGSVVLVMFLPANSEPQRQGLVAQATAKATPADSPPKSIDRLPEPAAVPAPKQQPPAELPAATSTEPRPEPPVQQQEPRPEPPVQQLEPRPGPATPVIPARNDEPVGGQPEPRPAKAPPPLAGRLFIPPLEFDNLQKSDKLTFVLPSEPEDRPTPFVWDGHTNHIRGVSFTDDGKFVVSISGDVYRVLQGKRQRPPDYSIRVWDARRGVQVHKSIDFTEPLDGLSVSRGGRLAVFGYGGSWKGGNGKDLGVWVDAKENHARLFDILANEEIPLPGDGPLKQPRFQGLDSSVFCSAFSPDRNTIIAGSNTGRLVLWDTRTAKALMTGKLATLPGWRDGVIGARFTPDGNQLVCSSDRTVWVFDARTGGAVATLRSHQDLVWCLDVTRAPGGPLLAISGGGSQQPLHMEGFIDGAKDYAIRLWDLGLQKEVRQFSGHERDVYAVAFRPKARQFVSAGRDCTVRLWDWESGTLLRTYTGHTQAIRALAVAPDGRCAVSGSDDCTLRYYQLPALAEDLAAALEAKQEVKVQQAIEDIDAMGPELRSVFPRLVKAVSGEPASLRPVIRKALHRYAELWRKGKIGTFERAEEPTLLALLETAEDAGLQSFAAEGLGQLGPQAERAAPALVKAAQAGANPVALKAAFDALASIGDRSDPTLAVLERHLEHPEAAVQTAATLALLRLGPQRVQTKQLTALMTRASAEVRGAAEQVLRARLATLTKHELPELRDGLRSPSVEVRVAFIDALGALKGDGSAAVPDLAALLDVGEPAVCRHALRALKAMGKSAAAAAPQLAALLTGGKDRELAVEAALALHRIDPENAVMESKGVPILAENLQPNAKDLQGFLARPLDDPSAGVLLECGAPAVKPLVQHLLTPHNPKASPDNQGVQATAARCLCYVLLKEMTQKKAKANPKLAVALKDQEDNIRLFWSKQEARLGQGAAGAGWMAPESRQLYLRAAYESEQLRIALAYLPLPKKK